VIAPSDHFERFPAEIIKQEITGNEPSHSSVPADRCPDRRLLYFRCMWSTPTEMQSTSENGFECLAEVRHEMVVKPPKSFKISLGCREVCTTF
jgi:hypothetical protein